MPSCGTPLQHTLIDLGMSPLCEAFTQDQLDAPETYYPLHARGFAIPAGWFSFLSSSARRTFSPNTPISRPIRRLGWRMPAATAEMIKSRLGLDRKASSSLGSNDGYLLQHFVALGVPVLGIEPAPRGGSRARQAFRRWSPSSVQTARQVVVDHGHADLIVANNVLAQVPELNDFVVGMAHLLAPEGVITIEVPHLERLIAENQFDTIYHEHFSYFSLGSIGRLASAHGLALIDVEILPTNGGSLRLYCPSRLAPPSRSAWSVGARAPSGSRGLFAYVILPAGPCTKRELLSVLKAKEKGNDLRLWRTRQRQHATQLLRNWTGFPGLYRRPQPVQARPLYPWDAHPDQAGRSGRCSSPRLYSDPALEFETGNRGADAARRGVGRKVHCPDPRDRRG
jgi:hypothetical protein